jgi:hypothetical protein
VPRASNPRRWQMVAELGNFSMPDAVFNLLQ